MDEAQNFDWLVAMNGGKVMATDSPAELLARTHCETLDAAFIALLPEAQRRGHRAVIIPPLVEGDDAPIAIEAEGLTMRFGKFIAVDHVSFRIRKGEIFGFLGSNGCGKSTTMKMLTGLLPATEGHAALFGQPVNPRDIATRRRVGYMSQVFSLYTELSVRQNLVLAARLHQMPEAAIPQRLLTLLTSPHDQRSITGITRFMDLRLKWYGSSAGAPRKWSSSSYTRDCRLRFRVGCWMRFTAAGCRKKRGHASRSRPCWSWRRC